MPTARTFVVNGARDEFLARAGFAGNQHRDVGRRDALERMAHLICEAHYRLSLVDAHQSQQIYFPLTQDDLADVLGLTPVHINRKLQQLRQEKLITLRSKQLTIHDLRTLQQIAGFDPAYLAPRVQTVRERERLKVIAA